jgi:hypothetical protein
MRIAVLCICLSFALWCSVAQAQGYAGVMAPADGEGSYQPSVPAAPAAAYDGVMGGDGSAAPRDYKAEKARRSEEIRQMNAAAKQERNERLRQIVTEERKIHEELQRQKELDALEQ